MARKNVTLSLRAITQIVPDMIIYNRNRHPGLIPRQLTGCLSQTITRTRTHTHTQTHTAQIVSDMIIFNKSRHPGLIPQQLGSTLRQPLRAKLRLPAGQQVC